MLVNTQRIQALAGRWSLNPTAIEARLAAIAWGSPGTFPVQKPPDPPGKSHHQPEPNTRMSLI